jgi:hypothetical protein
LTFVRLVATRFLEILASDESTDAFFGRSDGLFPLTLATVGVVDVAAAFNGGSNRTEFGRGVRCIPFVLTVFYP